MIRKTTTALLLIGTMLTAVPVFAEDASLVAVPSASTLAAGNELLDLQHRWAAIKYTVKDEKEQASQMETLAADAAAVAARHPDQADYMVWQAIILSTQAGMKGGLGALGLVKQARELLEQAEKIDAGVLGGAVPTSLGSLYYQVPGWPIGFGSKKKARAYLERAVALNPDGIDANFFYGDFLSEVGDYKQARAVLEHALQAPARPDRPVADAGRREEINTLLKKIDAKLAHRS